MIITQCNAVISLVDDAYHERAWCSVKVMIVSVLRRAYGLHLFYEHWRGWGPDAERGELADGPDQQGLSIQDKKLTFETDRPIVTFLARQSKFLG